MNEIAKYVETLKQRYDLSSPENFSTNVKRFLDSIPKKQLDITIGLTGNPFVDTGMIAISIQCNKNPQSLTLKDCISVFNDGHDLSFFNSSLKSYYMVFVNNPLTQIAYIKKKSDNILLLPQGDIFPSLKQEYIYRIFLSEILSQIGTDSITNVSNEYSLCISCGKYTSFDFSIIENSMPTLFGDESQGFGSGATRGWFPIIGAIGNDAQALPALTEAHVLCPSCIFCSQYIPQAVAKHNKYVVAYQSTNINMVKGLVNANIDYYKEQYGAGTLKKRIELYGSKNSKTDFIRSLIKNISFNYDPKIKTTMNLWLFSNSGTSPDCSLLELPNNALMWMHFAIKEGQFENVLVKCLQNEDKLIAFKSNHLLTAITNYKDYPLFYYDNKNFELLPISFFEFYQQTIRLWKKEELETARLISKEIKKKNSLEKIDRAVNEKSLRELKILIYNSALHLLSADQITIENLKQFVLRTPENNLLIARQYPSPFLLFKYYLNSKAKLEEEAPLMIDTEPRLFPSEALDYLIALEFFAEEIYTLQTKYSSMTKLKFKDFIINELPRKNNFWFQQMFLSVANKNQGFTYEKYDYLIKTGPKRIWKHLNGKMLDLTFLLQLVLVGGHKEKILPPHFATIQLPLNVLIEESHLSKDFLNCIINYIRFANDEPENDPMKKLLTLINDLNYPVISSQTVFKWISNDTKKTNFPMTEHLWDQEGTNDIGRFNWSELKFKLLLFLAQFKFILQTEEMEHPILSEEKDSLEKSFIAITLSESGDLLEEGEEIEETLSEEEFEDTDLESEDEDTE